MTSLRDRQILFTPDEFKGLVDILQEDAQAEVCMDCPFGNTLMFSSQNNDLYIRSGFKYLDGKLETTLEVARISLYNQHQGVGTKILYWLQGYAKTKGFSYIFIESVMTAAMKAFVDKHDFYLVDEGFELTEGFYGNWYRPL